MLSSAFVCIEQSKDKRGFDRAIKRFAACSKKALEMADKTKAIIDLLKGQNVVTENALLAVKKEINDSKEEQGNLKKKLELLEIELDHLNQQTKTLTEKHHRAEKLEEESRDIVSSEVQQERLMAMADQGVKLGMVVLEGTSTI